MAEQISNTSKAIKGMSSQTLVTIILGVVEIISFSIMSRLLTQQDFGYYAAISAVTMVFASFSETGIGSAIIQCKNISQSYINNAFTLSFIFGLVIMLLMLALSPSLAIMVADQSMTIPLMLMSVTLLCYCLTSVNISIMYRRLEFLRVGLINLISLIVTTIVAIILALNGFGYYAIITKAILASILTLVFSWIMAKTWYRFALDKNVFKSIFGFSGWLMASVLFRNLAQQLDRLLMTRLLSVQILGAYNRPKDFINQISNKFAGIFDTALFPVLSQIQDNKTSLKNAYLRSSYLLNLVSSILTIGFVFNAKLIVRIFFGEEWFNIVSVFQILSIAIVFYFNARLADCYLRSLGLTKQQFIFRILEVVAKVSGLLLGYHWGMIGIAISVLLTDAIMVIVKNVYIVKTVELDSHGAFLTLVQSISFSVLVLPFLVFFKIILPESLFGEVVFLAFFILLLGFCLLFMPKCVGKEYKETIYPQVIVFIKKILKSVK